MDDSFAGRWNRHNQDDHHQEKDESPGQDEAEYWQGKIQEHQKEPHHRNARSPFTIKKPALPCKLVSTTVHASQNKTHVEQQSPQRHGEGGNLLFTYITRELPKCYTFAPPFFTNTKNLTSDWEETAAVTTMYAYSLPDIVKADELQNFAAHGRFAFTPGAGRSLFLLTDTLYG